MPRPQGSKNKKAFEHMESIENIDERIAATETAVTAQKSCEKSAPNSEARERREMAHMFYDSLHGM